MSRLRVMGLTINVTPSTNPIFAMFEPSALPTANSPESARADMTEIRTSGADVPSETIVSPISMGVRPARFAIAEAPSTNRSALQTRAIKPPTMPIEYQSKRIILIFSVIVTRGPSADRVLWRAGLCRVGAEPRPVAREPVYPSQPAGWHDAECAGNSGARLAVRYCSKTEVSEANEENSGYQHDQSCS